MLTMNSVLNLMIGSNRILNRQQAKSSFNVGMIQGRDGRNGAGDVGMCRRLLKINQINF